MAGATQAATETNILGEVMERFRATKPAVVMNYDVTYTLLGFNLTRIANATLKTVEGGWRVDATGEWLPACLVDFHVVSPGGGGSSGEGRIRLFKQTVSVLTLPDLRIVTYAKLNDEYIKPLFGAGQRTNYVERYDFQGGGVDYRHCDLVSGAVVTNLPCMADLAKQSTQVGEVLEALYAAYRDKAAAVPPATPMVHFNVDGAVRPFVLKTKPGRTRIPVLSRKLDAVYADVSPKANTGSRNESFSMWCMPFRAFSRETRDADLQALGETSLEHAMLPLSGEYSLFIGAMECTLTSICAQASSALPPTKEGASP